MLQITVLVCYIAGSWLLFSRRLADSAGGIGRPATPALAFGLLGLALHAFLLADSILGESQPELSIANVVSLVGWLLAAAALAIAWQPQLRGLASILIPAAGVAALATGAGGDPGAAAAGHDLQLQAHIAVSVLGYTVLSLGALIAVAMFLQDRAIRGRHPSTLVRLMPPLETTERALFTAISIGFALLTLSVFSGIAFIEDMFAQHLAHKTILSIVAWFVFGTLLLGRWRLGWRGRRAMALVLSGYISLLLAYFGSRFILEVMLQRQWH